MYNRIKLVLEINCHDLRYYIHHLNPTMTSFFFLESTQSTDIKLALCIDSLSCLINFMNVIVTTPHQ